MAEPNVFAVVLAGGEGKRLMPLTADRAKPAVPFGGVYRMIDFALSNLVNGGLLRIAVLTQYKSHSLDRHISTTWRLSPLLGNYVASVPAQMRRGRHWFAGSADALYQNFDLLKDENPDYVMVVGADHIYRMNPRPFIEQHIATGAAATVAAIRVPRDQASEFGVIEADGARIRRFREKPRSTEGLPDAPDQIFASMGNYIFTRSALMAVLTEDAANPKSRHDMGVDIIPAFVERQQACVYDFSTNLVPGSSDRDRGYWRDVGTIDAYFAAHQDLISVDPVFNLYNREWPLFSSYYPLPPAKFVFDDDERRGHALESMVSPGVVISGATVRRSVLSPQVHVHSGAVIEDSVLMDGVDVGRGAIIRRAIIDKHVVVPPGASVGSNLERDRARFTVSDNGITVVGKRAIVESAG
ncbi:MAG: glucose-1-phosphate adenylyltransferase [Candidatus Dormibacteria bacterium]